MRQGLHPLAPVERVEVVLIADLVGNQEKEESPGDAGMVEVTRRHWGGAL